MAITNTTPKQQHALSQIRKQGGMLRTNEALSLGIHPRTLYALRDMGLLQRLSLGLYRLSSMSPLAEPDWEVVARRFPKAVICLVSALAFHNLTTQIPHVIDVAVKKGSQRPELDYPPLRVFWFSGSAWDEGVEVHILDATPVQIFCAAKTVADCFKFRNKLGSDIALEALRLYRSQADFQVDQLMHYARIDRVERVLIPYLETLL